MTSLLIDVFPLCTKFPWLIEPTKTVKNWYSMNKIKFTVLAQSQKSYSLYTSIFDEVCKFFLILLKVLTSTANSIFNTLILFFTGLAETNKAGKVTSVGYKPCIDMCQVRVVTLTRCVLFLQNVCLWPTGKNKQDISNMDLKHFTDSDQQR